MIVTRGLATVTAVLSRKEAGTSVVGFLAVLNAVTTIALLAFWLILLRGLSAETGIGPFLAIPVLIPLGVAAGIVFLLWLARSMGYLAALGPMREDDTPDGFSGHAAEPWWKYTAQLREWTILERHQPAGFVIAGLLLCLTPWTRAVGLLLFAVALEASLRATSERRAEFRRKHAMKENDPYARIVPPMRPVHTAKSIDQQLAEMGSDYLALLDEQSRAELESRVEQGWNDEGAVTRPVGGNPPVRKPLLREPMEPLPSGRFSLVVLIITLGLIVNFTAGDPAGLYQHMPAGFRGALDSIDRELGAIGVETEDEDGEPLGLTGRVLEQIDPDELARRNAERRAAVLAELTERLDLLDAAAAEQRTTARARLGVEIHPDAGTAAFDALLLEDAEARGIWISVIEDMRRTDAARASLRGTAETDDPSTTTADLRGATDEAQALIDALASVDARTEELLARLGRRAGRSP